MSRETKIGMLTGLLVIVLIGVLLSEYLGNGGPETKARPTVMAAGEPERRAIREPVMAPGQVREPQVNNAMTNLPNDGQPEVPTAMATGNGGPVVTPPAEVVDRGQAREVATGGRTTATELGGEVPGGGHPVTYITPEEARRAEAIRLAAGATTAATRPAEVVVVPTTKTEIYTIAKGDTLTIIAKKYYKTAGKAEFTKIIAANPALLKDEKSQLVVGKKLNIPGVPVAVAPVATVLPPMAPVLPGIGPGPGAPLVPVAPPVAGSPGTKIYVVVAKDTIEKIARKISPTNVTATTKAIMTLNNLKPDSVLQINQKLKVPDMPVLAAASDLRMPM